MRIFRDIDQIPNIRNCVVTTGSFDGVHIGHQALINRLNQLARENNGESTLITFYPHVRKVLYPDTAGKELEMINSQKEKIELLEKTGLDNLIIITFTKEFAQTKAEDFVRNILVGKLGAKIIVVGFNHYFGHNKEGNYEKLIEMGKELNFQVVEIPPQELEKETVGSSKIRKSLKQGKIMHANAYLDHIYFINTHFTEGSHLYRNAGFKTFGLTIEEDSKLIPPDGIYAISAAIEGDYQKGMLLNNYHGSFRHPELKQAVEVYFFQTDGKNYHKMNGKVFVHKEIRKQITVHDSKILRQQLLEDKKIIEDLIY
ncbi:MAG TPA: riboflavin kinase [Bacteroidales bacterium]|nr:riboflavin kinase [Bacteroidales bacterium]HRW97540.1 riboflavin kinase [Bacteroidales bacterium]